MFRNLFLNCAENSRMLFQTQIRIYINRTAETYIAKRSHVKVHPNKVCR